MKSLPRYILCNLYFSVYIVAEDMAHTFDMVSRWIVAAWLFADSMRFTSRDHQDKIMHVMSQQFRKCDEKMQKAVFF